MRSKKILQKIFIGLTIAIVLLLTTTAILFFNEIRSLISLNKLDAHPFYVMTYYGDYGFDEFLEIGAESDQDIERFVMKRLLKGIEIDLNISSAGCTVFTAQNSSKERIYARNFDFDYAPSLLVYTEPAHGYRSLSMVNLSYAGYDSQYLPQRFSLSSFLTLAAPYLPFEGINEKGVTMALLAVPFSEPPQEPDQITLNTTTAIRLVLDKAENTEEAIRLLKNYNYYFSGDVDCHYLISDPSGRSVIVEFMNNEVQIIETEKSFQIASNFIQYNDLLIGEGYCEFERYEKAEEVLSKSNGVLSEDDAMRLLSDVSIPGKTQWSAVYSMESLALRLCINRNYDDIFYFSLPAE